MCIIVLAIGKHPEYPLILAHNRDESWLRPTEDACEHGAGVVFAKDLKAGGSFMGMNLMTGAFAALTNVRSKHLRPQEGLSRGELVTSAVGHTAPVDFQGEEFTAFNLWHGQVSPEGDVNVTFSRNWPAPASPHGWQSASSRCPPVAVVAHSNEPSGDQWDESWPRTRWLRREVSKQLEALPRSGVSVEMLRDDIARIMSTTRVFPKEELPDLRFSDQEAWREVVLQQGPLVSRRAARKAAVANGLVDWEYGTTCQSLVLVSRAKQKFHYFYRSTKNLEQNPGAWIDFEAPFPAATPQPAPCIARRRCRL